MNAQPLCTYAYNADGTLASETYGNGDVNSYAYDSLDRLISQSYNGTARYTYAYNAENQLARHQDSENGVVWTYGYDLAGRITEQDCSNKTAVRYTYDDTGNIGSYRVSKDSALLSGATYTYIQDSLLRTVTMNSMDNLVITYNYDGLNRCKSRVQTYNPAEPDNDIRTSYLYLEGAGSDTTGLIRYISYVKYNSNVSQGPIKPSFYYTYDNKGNILTVKEGNVLKVTYTYDGLSRLVREDNVWLDKSVTYTYDNGGNILNKKYYAYTTGELSSVLDTVDYTYDSVWKDKLTSYNGGSTITYDEIGNPLTYRGYNLTWVKGRQLRLVQGNGVSQIYNYNADGLRTRSYSGSKFKFTYYTYASGLLVSQTDGTNTLNFVYSPAGEALGFTCNGTKYFYMRNVQGDVIGIYDSTGTVVVEYTYDAWGKPNSVTGSLASTIGVINPLRYRGYYYDDETGFYYLQSRYYDPETGRFLNADGELAGVGESVQGYNLFAYCHNNPVNMSDPDGNWPKWLTGALNVVSGALQMAAGAALGATVGWTGVGAVAAGFLIVNGAATATQGVGQIVNDVTKSNVMREDNIVRTGVKSVGKEIGGKTGEKVAGFAYDTAVVAANLYAGKVGLEKSMPKIIESKVFSANNGYGFKLGKNIEMFYRNPNAAGGPGGTIFSYKGPLGKFRIDWDPAHSFHCHPPGH
ncbi:MAG: tRNA(Glu)-specific nuclease WapA precursor [Firmicutes bacterium ADurb.Bin300]|nr:MAG: tRNA(Glu)-specific nuclease WapA precursor [Firmicutes bacterium ADurb.Bin300]